MNTIFMNYENSKTCDPHRVLLNLTDKIKLKRDDKYVVLSNLRLYLAFTYMEKYKKIIQK